jgi:hypothetical protein
VDFSLCINRNRIPNDPVASKDRRQGTDPFFAYDVDYAYTGARLAHGEELIEPFGDAHAHPMCEAINIGHGFIDIGRGVHGYDHNGFAQSAHGDACIAAVAFGEQAIA